MRKAVVYVCLGLILLAAVAAFLWASGLPSTGATGGPLMALALLGLACLVYAALMASGGVPGEAPLQHPRQTDTRPVPARAKIVDSRASSGGDRQRRALDACNPEGIIKGEAEIAHRRRFRMLVESRPLGEAESFTGKAISRLGDPGLVEAFASTSRTVGIDSWARITGAAKAVQREGHGAFIASLIHRNHECEDFAVNLLYAKPEKSRAGQWPASSRLPGRPHSNALGYKEERPRVIGLEPLREMQDRATSPYEVWGGYHDAIFTAQMLAAQLVMVRFFQAIERCAAESPLPQGLPVFLTIDHEEWPMETGTVDFCDFAVRPLHGT